MNGFGARLRKLRMSQDLTQHQLGEKLGVVPSTIGKYEKVENSFPSVEVLIKLSDFFHVSIDYLLKGKDTVPPVENNIGNMSNSPFIQANNGGTVVHSPQGLTPECMELLHIYEGLSGRDRLKLLNYAIEIERSAGK